VWARELRRGKTGGYAGNVEERLRWIIIGKRGSCIVKREKYSRKTRDV
jgi:hypothetical protein